MRTTGSPAELEYRRRLAVRRLQEGYPMAEVAAFLEVDASTVRRWRATFRCHGQRVMAAKPVAGRPAKLSATQEKIICRWLRDPASAHGFATELWTGGRLAWLIKEEFGVAFHPSYLSAWLRVCDYTPQTPERVPRERDPQAIARGLEADWPRIKKRPVGRALVWCSSTREAS